MAHRTIHGTAFDFSASTVEVTAKKSHRIGFTDSTSNTYCVESRPRPPTPDPPLNDFPSLRESVDKQGAIFRLSIGITSRFHPHDRFSQNLRVPLTLLPNQHPAIKEGNATNIHGRGQWMYLELVQNIRMGS